MHAVRSTLVRTVLIVAALSVVGCGGSGNGQTSSGTPANGSKTSTTQKTVAKSKPSAPPTITQLYCQSIMTVADANQIMSPPIPATTITAQSSSDVGVCSYLSPQLQFAVVKILMDEQTYTGPNPVPESTIIQLATQLANEPGATVSATSPVSGVGDQAEFLAASVSDGTITFYADAIYVIYGKVAFMCDDFHLGGSKPADATQQQALQQCAQRTITRLSA